MRNPECVLGSAPMVSQDVPDGIVAVPPEADQPRAEVVGDKALIGAEVTCGLCEAV